MNAPAQVLDRRTRLQVVLITVGALDLLQRPRAERVHRVLDGAGVARCSLRPDPTSARGELSNPRS